MDYEKIVQSAGGKFLGITHDLIWFNCPSGTTVTLHMCEFSEDRVRLKIIEDGLKDYGGASV